MHVAGQRDEDDAAAAQAARERQARDADAGRHEREQVLRARPALHDARREPGAREPRVEVAVPRRPVAAGGEDPRLVRELRRAPARRALTSGWSPGSKAATGSVSMARLRPDRERLHEPLHATVEPASNAKTTIDWVHRILKEERDIVISSRPLEATALQVENIRIAYVFYESGLSINVMYTVDDPKKRAVGFKLSEGMEGPAELASRFKFARQKSKLAGTIRGFFFAFNNEY
jgi:hypothetical protein